MALSWWGKGLWQICMYHWRVHVKVEFPRFPPGVRTGGSIPQPTSNTHLTSVKSGTEMMVWSNVNALLTIGWGVHSTTFDAELRNVSFTLISFMGFSAILSALQPFQICIYNRKYSKLTFSNGSQLMGKRFMANLHAPLETTCKSRISKIFTRCQKQGGSIPQLLMNSEM